MEKKAFPVDGSPYMVVVCYRLYSTAPLVMKPEKRLTNEEDRGNTLAYLLKEDRDTVLRGFGQLSPSELEHVVSLARVIQNCRRVGGGGDPNLKCNDLLKPDVPSPSPPIVHR